MQEQLIIGRFFPLDKSISFSCWVDKEELKATVLGSVEQALNHCFRISFSDGTTDDFTLLENGIVISETIDMVTKYSQAVRKDFIHILFSTLSPCVYILRKGNRSKAFNIWIISEKNEENVFSVYYKNDYRFTLEQRDGKWNTYSIRVLNPNPIDPEIVKEVCELIDRQS